MALLGDKPEEGLVAGQVGTVVEVLAPGVFEVEFLDSHGRTVGVAELKREELLAGLYRLRQSKRDKGPVNTGWDEGLVCMS